MRNAESSRTFFWKSVVLFLVFVLNVAFFFRLVWGPQSFVAYRDMKAQYAALNDEIARYDAINATLSREIRLLQSDDLYVEKIIRQRLNFVRDNEILYLFENRQDSSGAAEQ